MQHPTWYIKVFHLLLRLIGADKIIFGSTGHSGREPPDQLVEYLRRGYSTLLMKEMGFWKVLATSIHSH